MIKLSQPTTNQTEQSPVTLLTDAELDDWLSGYTDEEIEEIAAMWQRHAGKLYKNVVVAEDASTP